MAVIVIEVSELSLLSSMMVAIPFKIFIWVASPILRVESGLDAAANFSNFALFEAGEVDLAQFEKLLLRLHRPQVVLVVKAGPGHPGRQKFLPPTFGGLKW